MADSDKIRIISNIASFADVTKSLQEVEKALNGIVDSIKTPAEKELKETEGSTGDIQITQNADKSYTFEIRTEEGWKTPVIGNNAIKFKNKPAESAKNQDKSIDEIEADDTLTSGKDAEKTIYDEKEDKFKVSHLTGIPRADYDSGWVEVPDQTVTGTHNLGVLPSLHQVIWSLDNGVSGHYELMMFNGSTDAGHNTAITTTTWHLRGWYNETYGHAYTNDTGTGVYVNATSAQADLRVRVLLWK